MVTDTNEAKVTIVASDVRYEDEHGGGYYSIEITDRADVYRIRITVETLFDDHMVPVFITLEQYDADETRAFDTEIYTNNNDAHSLRTQHERIDWALDLFYREGWDKRWGTVISD